jgi:uncharacterized SAM-binding protein YcdF (DUF218 family)
MDWIFAIALLVFGGFLMLDGSVALGLILLIIGVLTTIRCIIGIAFKVVWKLIRKPLAIVLAIVLVIMALTSVPILLGVRSQPEAACDWLIVLGAGVDGDTPSPILQDRINAAYDYLTKHPDTVCIATGGKGDDENLSEAQCIYNHLTQMGISGDRIWMEDQATSTVENFRYSIDLLKQETGSIPKSVGVLSNEFHLFRASLMAKDNGLSPIFIAAPTSDAWTRIYYTVREIFVLWNYLITGG